jgi:hypothetical protein
MALYHLNHVREENEPAKFSVRFPVVTRSQLDSHRLLYRLSGNRSSEQFLERLLEVRR